MTSVEKLAPFSQDTPRVAEVRKWCLENNLHSALFQWEPTEEPHNLEWWKEKLHAASLPHLCKAVLLENTHCTRADCSDPKNSRFYMIVYQYLERFDASMLSKVVKEWNEGLGKKKFSFALSSPESFEKLTGFSQGALVPFCTSTHIPVIMSASILALSPAEMWFGGGHRDCKLRVGVQDFINVVKPEIASFTVPMPEDKIDSILV